MAGMPTPRPCASSSPPSDHASRHVATAATSNITGKSIKLGASVTPLYRDADTEHEVDDVRETSASKGLAQTA